MTTEPDRSNADRELLIYRRIARALARARLALFWERLWPRLVPLLIVIGLFVLVSWSGFWQGIPDWLRIATVALFGVVAIASLYPLISLRWPSRADAFSRIERTTGAPHRPATGFLDRIAGKESDPETRAIWEAHRARLIAGFGTLRAGAPSPGVPRRDPYGFRFLLLLLLVVAFVATGGGFDRLADAFRGGPSIAIADIAAARIDAWAAPPEYTGRPSILLAGETVRPVTGPLEVPQGTEIVIRVAGDDNGAIAVVSTGSAVVEMPRLGEGPREFRIVLDAPADVTIAAGGEQLEAWSFGVIADMAPTISVIAGPERAGGGGLQVAYAFADDYGVTEAWGEFTLITQESGARPLVDAPEFNLTVPRSDPIGGEAITVRDLTEHPWAGLELDLTLVAADAIGQIGLSDTHRVTLPGRVFIHPIARELVAQRQHLALDARQADNVALAVGRLAAMPQALEDFGIFLALRSAFYRLRNTHNDDERRDFLDYLWEIATAIEADPLADAAAELQAAADALREAIARGADDAEIAELTEYLRNAMGQYMQALAAGMQQRQAQPAAAVDTQVLRPEQLDEMVDQIQDFAQTGNLAAAEQLLDQVERMMQNMQAGNLEGAQREFQPGQEALDDLGYLMQEQQRLMDETFEMQQQQFAPIPNPRNEEEAAQVLDELMQRRADQEALAEELAREQRLLRDNLTQLLERMMGNGEETFGLAEAEGAMGDAAERLGEAQPDLAVADQAEALEQLRATAEALAQQMAEQNGMGMQLDNEGQQDPFGRPPPLQGERYGDNVQVPTEIDRQTARQILQIIRQRLEDRGRPAAEIEYLERLIELY